MEILARHIRGCSSLIGAWLILSGHGYGQLPPVGIIDFYGIQRVPEKDVRTALRVRPGDDAIKVMEAADDTRQRLLSLPEVADAAVSVVCCDSETGRSIVFVGIREKGASALRFRR